MASVSRCTRAEWRRMCQRMSASCPAPEGYVWRFLWVQPSSLATDEAGTVVRREGAEGQRGAITIRIAQGESERLTQELLVHEVAHAFDMWTHHSWAEDHGATFGVWYARVYCRFWGVS